MTAGGVPGEDHPEERGLVELLLSERGAVLVSWVERLEGKELVVTAGRDRNQCSVRLDVGDRVEMIWKAPANCVLCPPGWWPSRGRGAGPAGGWSPPGRGRG
ncbi:hypothetical protein A7K94_0212110, partial [Modestobacter sp. VKM Ac-2676]